MRSKLTNTDHIPTFIAMRYFYLSICFYPQMHLKVSRLYIKLDHNVQMKKFGVVRRKENIG